MADDREVLSEYPRVVRLKKFLADHEVAHLLALGEGKYVKSTVVDNKTGESVEHEHRTGWIASLEQSQDGVVRNVEERIANVTGTRQVCGEALQIVKYGPGDQYKPHFDWFDPNESGPSKHLWKGGQRTATCILFLKAAEEGGETEFPELPKATGSAEKGLRVKCEAGDALFFTNVDSDLKPDRRMLHAGVPVVKGEKIIATRWIHQRAVNGSEEPAELEKKLADEQKAKSEEEKVRKEANEKLQALRAAREKACWEEVNVILRKHGCALRAILQVRVDDSGYTQHGASVHLTSVE